MFKENIGAVLIAKNAEPFIEKAIRSVLPVARQIVVVDTGSSDKTPTIATRLGVEVHFRKWDDDFSHTRNYALGFMRTEWIISLDSDEILNFDSFNKNKYLLENHKTGGLKVKILNYLKPDNRQYQTEHEYTRIFRNHPKIRYSGSIHEQINDSISNEGFGIVNSEIIIEHYGYINTSQDKIRRNQILLEKELVKKPDDNWYKFHLAETEFAGGNNLKAKELFESLVFAVDLTTEQKETTCIKLSQIALKDNLYDDVEKWLNFKSENTHTEGFRKFILAASYMMQKRFDEALLLIESNEVKNSMLVDKVSLNQAFEVIKRISEISD